MSCTWILAATAAVLGALLCEGAIVPPPWADPGNNPCASRPGGWQLLYWPGDGKCYKIFTKGPPCPVSMELTPGPDRRAVCRCPPGTALHKGDNLCHPLYSTSPCPPQHYFAPVPQSSPSERWGVCEAVAPCPHPGELFYPRDTRCYQSYTQGPCPRGQLLAPGSPNSTLGQCRCDQDGRLGRYYWPATGTCHQHWTPGPCQEKGTLFLPEGKCGCHAGLPHYHSATRQCYQIGTVGPCPPGHHFVMSEDESDVFTDFVHAKCQCKRGHVRWDKDGVCYRPYTRGPCSQGNMFSVETQQGDGANVTAACVPVPCPPGRLWFPGQSGCHRVGSQGPCPPGQVVLFQDSVRTSVEGVSYQGMCGCAIRSHDDRSFYPTLRSDERGPQYGRCGAQSRREDNRVDPDTGNFRQEEHHNRCEGKRGFVLWVDGSCQQLYARGPCPAGQWLVPSKGQRQGRGEGSGGRCECLPSFTPSVDPASRELICHPPSVTIARYLNKLAADAA
ncbi:multiple epidermal growth factor-like domains protein 6 [Macrosteles quadrilineatus]|uniref:multiple epidermal growth factor-like domains protein 6 n=1 Tax=Macrosteles quadrilineatus TaxID=74068 RepID=UPI0023E2A2FC|nr:multiple epidermal growth factor-like domains protein 6 [Macrosteles quadrilineatus]